jgi:serine/threonine protein kinase
MSPSFFNSTRFYLGVHCASDSNLFRSFEISFAFSISDGKFSVAEIACAFTSFPSLRVIQRDLKNENTLFDGDGHIRLAKSTKIANEPGDGAASTFSAVRSIVFSPRIHLPSISVRSVLSRLVQFVKSRFDRCALSVVRRSGQAPCHHELSERSREALLVLLPVTFAFLATLPDSPFISPWTSDHSLHPMEPVYPTIFP